MTIAPGNRVGVYEVGELLGEGGMGTVYRARDSRLQRDVAIKVIRPDLASDSDHAARFDREARLLASLNHPHVATVHGLEQAGDVRVLVLELVSGDTLAERLRSGPLPVPDVLALARQIASGIEAAHDRGIVHRDLKPENIKITESGAIKILDFGLAKALSIDSPADTSSPTIIGTGTAKGIVLGTAAYMSPEQTRGKEIDRRTDIWAFGCVVYDMLTGRRAFESATVSDTIVAILTRDPDWSRLPHDTPPPLRRMLGRCLQKDLSSRLRDIGDAKLDIEEALTWNASEPRAETTAVASPGALGGRRRVVSSLVAGGLVGAVVGALAVSVYRPLPSAVPTGRAQFAVSLAEGERITGLDFPAIAMSPVGKHVAYVASRSGHSQLFVRAVDALESRPLAGTDGALSPFFSPDGEWIAFFTAGSMKKVAVGGGPVQPIADAPIGFGGAWARDNTIIFAPSNASELWRVSADGGKAQPVTALDTSRGEFSHRWPEILPDGKSVLFAVGTEGSWDDAVIALQTIGAQDRRVIVQGGTSPRFSASGHILFTRGGALYALPFSGQRQTAAAEAVAGVEQIVQSSDGAAQFSISSTGVLLYVPGSDSENARALVWVDRDGNEQPLAAPSRAFGDPRMSPDGRIAAVTIGSDIWLYDIGTNRLTQFTFAGGSSPVWSPNGQRIVFAANRGGSPDLFAKAVDGSSVEERLSRTPRTDVPCGVTADGSIVFVEADATGRDISVLSSDGAQRPLIASPANESAAVLSSDEKAIAYVSDSSGQPEVYVAPFDNPQRATRVSIGGGTEPVWRRDGGELYFRSGTRMMAAAVRTQPSVSVQQPRELFKGTLHSGAAWRSAYDVAKDGTRFLMVRPVEGKLPGDQLRVVLGWRP
jgi:eukaryotic-like serine/threonine-protein kinase